MSSPQFSHRVGSTNPNPVTLAVYESAQQGISLRGLNDSNPTHYGLAPAELPQQYSADPRGDKSTRETLADFLAHRNTNVSADNLYILSSTSQAYAWIFMLMCDVGDVVLAPTPGYPLIESIARLTGVNVLFYEQFYDDRWSLDAQQIEELIKSAEGKVRSLVLINPNNPTGSYIKAQERASLIELCKKYGLAIIADEVFYDYDLEPFEDRKRWAGEDSVLTFALDGFSKMLAAPHAKVGWIQVSGPTAEVFEAKKRLDMIADDFLPISEFQNQAIARMLRDAPEQTARVKARVTANLKHLHEVLNADIEAVKSGDNGHDGVVSVLRAEGGWNVLLRFPSTIDENELSKVLIRDFKKQPQPGYFFDMTSNGYVTLSLLPEPDIFDENIRAILAAVHTFLH